MPHRRRLPAALLALLLGALLACGGQDRPAEPLREVLLELQGLDCAGCAQTVHAALAGVRGVRAVEVDHETLRARVTCAPTTDPEDLARAVAGAGRFQARPLAR